MIENSRSIAQWGEDTFGKATLKSLALRAREELGELIEAIDGDKEDKAVKFLGVFIDENLSWKYHLNHISNQISRSLYTLKQAKNSLPLSCFLWWLVAAN